MIFFYRLPISWLFVYFYIMGKEDASTQRLEHPLFLPASLWQRDGGPTTGVALALAWPLNAAAAE